MFGKAPIVTKQFEIPNWTEFCFVQDMMIKSPNGSIVVPDQYCFLKGMIDNVIKQISDHRVLDYWDIADLYIYVSAKHMFVNGGSGFSRPGWHSDGFGTNDITCIWSDSNPTEFCVQEFNLRQDCYGSMEDMVLQAKDENIVTYSDKTLLILDQSVIHRASQAKPGYRKFFKMVFSKNKFNLEGNTINRSMEYPDWEWKKRDSERNHTSK